MKPFNGPAYQRGFIVAGIARKIGSWVAHFFATTVGVIIAKGLAALGLSYVTYQFAVPEFVGMIQQQLGALPADWLGVIYLAKVDVATTIVFSAIAVRMASRVFFVRS